MAKTGVLLVERGVWAYFISIGSIPLRVYPWENNATERVVLTMLILQHSQNGQHGAIRTKVFLST